MNRRKVVGDRYLWRHSHLMINSIQLEEYGITEEDLILDFSNLFSTFTRKMSRFINK